MPEVAEFAAISPHGLNLVATRPSFADGDQCLLRVELFGEADFTGRTRVSIKPGLRFTLARIRSHFLATSSAVQEIDRPVWPLQIPS